MKEVVIQYLKEHPYTRLRYINLGLPRFDILDILCELKREGIADTQTYRDNANMEFYDLWFIK